MKGNDTVFFGIMKFLPKEKFDFFVKQQNGDKWAKKITSWDILINVLSGQLSGELTLRGITDSQYGLKKELAQLSSVSLPRSSLSDACNNRPYNSFLEALNYLIRVSHRKIRRDLKGVIKILDSTPIQLRGVGYDWTKSNYRIQGIKTHVVFYLEQSIPGDITFSDANVNDIEEGKKITLLENTTYCFDRAYYDFRWWAAIASKRSRFVTRLKSNTPYKVLKRNSKTHSDIKHDWVIEVVSKKSGKLNMPLRHIKVKRDTGGYVEIISNDLESPAEEIAAIYRARWKIELFFKWIKGKLKIKHFISKSENGVKIQIIIAMIAYVLLRLTQEKYKLSKSTLSSLTRIIKRHLYASKSIGRLLNKFKILQHKGTAREVMI